MALHPECKTWEKVVDKELVEGCLPISLSRVMRALYNRAQSICYVADGEAGCDCWHNNYDKVIKELLNFWHLTENGKDLYLEDQSKETKKVLNKLFKV